MLATTFLLTLGLALLVGGGELLLRGASALARRLGVQPVIIGLTVVAFGTSVPELVVNLSAATSGRAQIAFGNVIGSNIANIGLILGIAACIRPLQVRGTLILREIPMMVLATVAVAVMAVEPDFSGLAGTIDRSEGVCLLLFFAIFLYALVLEIVRDRPRDALTQEVELSVASEVASESSAGWVCGAMIVAGLLCLIGGGQFVVASASELARSLGVPEVVIGLTIVAVGTSLPELITSTLAAARGDADVAIGNVVGSNIFNLFFILGATTAVEPMPVPNGGFADLLVALALAVLLVPFSLTHRRRLLRAEGIVLLLAWVSYTVWRTLMPS